MNKVVYIYFLEIHFFRKILCFLLKLVTMQFTPVVIYMTVYYNNKHVIINPNNEQRKNNSPNKSDLEIDLLDDDAASVLNRTITSQISRTSLLSGNDHGGSQYL
eukprot:GHVR01078202.1.p4 GENE.GHVR01078202.1~~GHVR01078202.1.p4  ORF type:complete len:104 (-),score=5.51 GHVR01078202.1:115-426(-)